MNNNKKWLLGAILLAPLATLLVWLVSGTPLASLTLPTPRTLLLVVVFVPLCEEIVFRGLLQHELASYEYLHREWYLLSWDNLITSTLFTVVHAVYFAHPAALLLQFPALIIGFFYHRYHRLVYPVGLHIWYNANGLLAFSLLK